MKLLISISVLVSLGTSLAISSGVESSKSMMQSVPYEVENRFIKAFGPVTTQNILDTGCARTLYQAHQTGVWLDEYCYRTYNHLLEKL